MHSLRLVAVGSIAAVVLGLPKPAAAATIIIDNFNDGTTMGWTAGGGPAGAVPPSPPSNTSDFLLLQSAGGNGPGSRLTAFNGLQWAGDYVAAGITSITMDVNNFGPTDLSLRLSLSDPFGSFQLAYTTAAIPVISGAGWTSIEFSLLSSSMTLVGATTLEEVLDSVLILRIYHSTDDVTGQPTSVVGTLGIDNIGAQAPLQVPAPEPATMWLMSAGILVALRRLRAVGVR